MPHRVVDEFVDFSLLVECIAARYVVAGRWAGGVLELLAGAPVEQDHLIVGDDGDLGGADCADLVYARDFPEILSSYFQQVPAGTR